MSLVGNYIGIITVMLFGAALAEYYQYDFKAITIIGNCLIPVLAIFLVCMLNEMQRVYKSLKQSSDDDY
ncbi:MAG: hypothetical protein PHI31_10000 [Desulfuromonadaceae bacterium]|nr:hypothetical protein [Desulfuromonadaceae bacterium]